MFFSYCLACVLLSNKSRHQLGLLWSLNRNRLTTSCARLLWTIPKSAWLSPFKVRYLQRHNHYLLSRKKHPWHLQCTCTGRLFFKVLSNRRLPLSSGVDEKTVISIHVHTPVSVINQCCNSNYVSSQTVVDLQW